MESALTLGALIFVIVWLLWRNVQGAPFYATNSHAMNEIVDIIEWDSRRVAELGSGDGRLAIALARRGALVDGYEFNPFLVWYSRQLVRRAGLKDRVVIRRKNFWNMNLHEYDAVAVFGMPHIMSRLGKKVTSECRTGTPVVSHAFVIPNLHLVKRSDRALLYEVH